jgi:hypothetical protein
MKWAFNIADNFKFNSRSLGGKAVREFREAKSRKSRSVSLAGRKLSDHVRDVLLPQDRCDALLDSMSLAR